MNKSKKTTKEFTLNELSAIESSIIIFRACPDIPFTVANDINANVSPIKEAINKRQDKISVLRERNEIIEKDKEKDLEKYRSAVNENNKELTKIFTEKTKVELSPAALSAFDGIEINGCKEVKQQDGSVAQLPYRDAYFLLLETGIIV